MNEDDLPPKPRQSEDGFAGELGGMVGTLVWVGVFLAVAGVALYLVMRWTGHSPW